MYIFIDIRGSWQFIFNFKIDNISMCKPMILVIQ